MIYKEIAPSIFLTDYIESYWFFNTQGIGQEQLILPDCCMDIIFDLASKKILICGVMTTARMVKIRKHQKLFGVRFHPGVLPVLLGSSAESLRDSVVLLKDIRVELYKKVQFVLRASSVEKISKACDVIFEKELKNPKTTILSRILIEKTHTEFSVKNFSDRLGVSVRHLERLFIEYVGVTPKRFLKIRRIQLLKKSLETDKKTLVSLSLQYGYSDQSHMSKEYKQLTGRSVKYE